MNRSRSAVAKAQHKLATFRTFAKQIGKTEWVESARSERPPLPDISCIEESVRVGFELLGLTDEGAAAATSRSYRGKAPNVAYNRPGIEGPESALLRKMRKSYKFDGPINLLIYTVSLSFPDEILIDSIYYAINNTSHVIFSRIYLMGDNIHMRERDAEFVQLSTWSAVCRN